MKQIDSSQSSESDDDDDMCTITQQQYNQLQNKKQRHSVSAEVFGIYNQKTLYVPHEVPKTHSQIQIIKHKINQSFLLRNLEQEDQDLLIRVMEIINISAGQTLIQQNTEGNHLYIVDTGELDCYKQFKPDQQEVFLKTYKSGETFGELALLYNTKRAATIKAKTDCQLFVIDRNSFKHIVQDATIQRRNKYESFLNQVQLLKTMDPYERLQICDVIKTVVYDCEDKICMQGEIGDMFFILLEGQAQAIKNGQVVFEYDQPGQYFGELSLLKDCTRQADVLAISHCKVLSIDRSSFQRLLGPLDNILQRNMQQYINFA